MLPRASSRTSADLAQAAVSVERSALHVMDKSPLDIAMEAFFAGDLVTAESLLLALARSGDGHAAHNLGTLYAVGGVGVAADPETSRFWYERALASGFEAQVASDPTWFRRGR